MRVAQKCLNLFFELFGSFDGQTVAGMQHNLVIRLKMSSQFDGLGGFDQGIVRTA